MFEKGDNGVEVEVGCTAAFSPLPHAPEKFKEFLSFRRYFSRDEAKFPGVIGEGG